MIFVWQSARGMRGARGWPRQVGPKARLKIRELGVLVSSLGFGRLARPPRSLLNIIIADRGGIQSRRFPWGSWQNSAERQDLNLDPASGFAAKRGRCHGRVGSKSGSGGVSPTRSYRIQTSPWRSILSGTPGSKFGYGFCFRRKHKNVGGATEGSDPNPDPVAFRPGGPTK